MRALSGLFYLGEIQPSKPRVFAAKRAHSKETQTGSRNGVAPDVEKEPNRLQAEAV
jgi:hypothetical protein